mmetsp:Transcript_9741/g.19855  ORF Transcript_9741/g.19855 Transcript_9741/m.19855 type:complete len:204 (-) Transcript_9741:119-730(-)
MEGERLSHRYGWVGFIPFKTPLSSIPFPSSTATLRLMSRQRFWTSTVASSRARYGRNDSPAVMKLQSYAPGYRVILFDGVCNLCNFWVDFLVRRDPDCEFRFAALQSPVGLALLERFHVPTDLSTLVYIDENESVHLRSEAVLRIALHVKGFAIISQVLLVVVPRSIRDWVYTYLVASPRYTVFGRRESCRLSDPQFSDRFLE